MEQLLEEVKQLDITELRAKLNELGILVGPIAPSTKHLFQKRLASKLFELQGGKKEDLDQETSSKPIQHNAVSSSETQVKNRPPSNSDVYYAVCLPEDASNEAESEQFVFCEKDEALKAAKKYKGSRFKSFKSEQEARSFTKLRAESTFSSPLKNPKEDTANKETKPSGESSPFKGPKPQDLAKLRKFVEAGDTQVFREYVWNNPRYLVGNGDTPAIFQEGSRYTAMHVAALKNQAEMCQVILDTLENPEFVNKLYCLSYNTIETQSTRINFLVDLYLNMPDKGNCESPLHMACKFGFEKVVEVLVSHPKTDRFLRNKWGDTPKDVICTRCPNATSALKDKIGTLLQGQCYVPLMRSEDNCTVPVIGQPWSADVNKSPLEAPQRTWSPRDPSMSVKACAGPMSPSEADKFHKRWTTPPSQSPDQARLYFNTKRSDSEKGLERIGRQLAHDMKVTWSEYWEFLGTFADLSNPSGLEALEDYFKKRVWLQFIQQFKEKYGGSDTPCDFSSCVTPIKIKQRDTTLSDSLFEKLEEKITKVIDKFSDSEEKQFGSSEDKKDDEVKDNKTKDASSERKATEQEDAIEGSTSCQNNESDKDGEVTENTLSLNDVLSPMSSLAVGFSKLQLKDESMSEKASSDTSLQTLDSSEEESYKRNGQEHIENKALSLETASEKAKPITKWEKERGDNGNHFEKCQTDNIDNLIDLDKCPKTKDTHLSESDTEPDVFIDCENNNLEKPVSPDCVEQDSKLASIESGNIEPVTRLFRRTLSDSSESVTSFITATEEVDVAQLSDVQDGEHSVVSIHIQTVVFEQLTEKVGQGTGQGGGKLINSEQALDDTVHELPESHETCKVITRVKSNGSNIQADIVYIPKLDNVNEMMVLEDVVVATVGGDLDHVEEGDIVGLKPDTPGVEGEGASTIQSYLTRASTLPKCGYIYGPQPTREDLDVSRAVGSAVICPDMYPNVFRWKISLSRFLKDTNYRWQSPARVKPRLSQNSPQTPSSPLLHYKSPVSTGSLSRVSKSSSLTADIRTQLFPAIGE